MNSYFKNFNKWFKSQIKQLSTFNLFIIKSKLKKLFFNIIDLFITILFPIFILIRILSNFILLDLDNSREELDILLMM